MSQIVPWKRDESRADLDRALQILRGGGLVGFPTETEYVVAADATNVDALKQLASNNAKLPILLPEPVKIEEWLPELSPLGKRLARKMWPGPVVIISSDGAERGRLRKLPADVRTILTADNSLAFRVPLHEAAWELSGHPNPIVLASAGSNEHVAHTAEQLVEHWGERVEIVFDAGAISAAKSPTVLRLSGFEWSLETEDAISAESIANAACCRIVFVCTGNTCRSPLAEFLFRKELADVLSCSPNDLMQHGFIVQSAGISAAPGSVATPESIKIAEELGGDLREHQSRLMTLELLLQSDYLFAMTQQHLAVLQNNLFLKGPFCALLSEDGDITDPFGAAEEVYRECAQQILQCVKKWAPHIQQEEAAVRPPTADRSNG